jgi:hypothetical protein
MTRDSRRARAMIVTIGLTPMPVGKTETVLKPHDLRIAMPRLLTAVPHALELTGSFGCSARGVA